MAERTLGEWLLYLEQLHPEKIDLGLTRVAEVARRLRLMPYPARVITVAGTNGKGSVAYCCEAILRGAGLRTGRYTSPHLLRYNERIAVDNHPSSDEAILRAFTAIDDARAEISLTYFEFATLAALWIFREAEVDVAVLEVGLGGRLDAVNIIDSDVAVITSIDLDHQKWLGDTVEAIAPEKAAVARADRPVVLAERYYPQSLFDTLENLGANVLQAQHAWHWERTQGDAISVSTDAGPIEAPCPQGLRAENVAAAVRGCACLGLGHEQLRRAVRELRQVTVPGRRQSILLEGRVIVLDVAHNPAAMAALVGQLQEEAVSGKTLAILGLMADKDLTQIVSILAGAVDGACALAIPGIERAQSPDRIWDALDAQGVAIAQTGFAADETWQQLWRGTDAGDRIVVCGSFHSVAAIMDVLLARGLVGESGGVLRPVIRQSRRTERSPTRLETDLSSSP